MHLEFPARQSTRAASAADGHRPPFNHSAGHPSDATQFQLAALAGYLAGRREAILLAWRVAARADPEQTTARSLSRGQFNDHIPEVLDAFERDLRARPGDVTDQAAALEAKEKEVKHGLHRWQQGYRLHELIHEWGHLQLCVLVELETFAAGNPGLDSAALAAANRQLIVLVNNTIGESADQYARLQKAEAAGHVHDLERSLASVSGLERRRATLIHQAVHDLRGEVQSVSLAAAVLHAPGMIEADRAEFTGLLQQGVRSVTGMLRELMELARLEAGQEHREIAPFDVAAMVTELCNAHQPLAQARSLFLRTNGPPQLIVDGDAGKVRRLAQNLLLNALKYTATGGVQVKWGEEKENWWMMVKDSGPGLAGGSAPPILAGLKEATASARESDEKSAEAKGEVSHVLTPADGPATGRHAAAQMPGEGIGLSIVKRLCELLDASLELASSAETGSTFRVVFPRHYKAADGGNLAG